MSYSSVFDDYLCPHPDCKLLKSLGFACQLPSQDLMLHKLQVQGWAGCLEGGEPGGPAGTASQTHHRGWHPEDSEVTCWDTVSRSLPAFSSSLLWLDPTLPPAPISSICFLWHHHRLSSWGCLAPEPWTPADAKVCVGLTYCYCMTPGCFNWFLLPYCWLYIKSPLPVPAPEKNSTYK